MPLQIIHASNLSSPSYMNGPVVNRLISGIEPILALKSVAETAGFTTARSADGNSIVGATSDVFNSNSLAINGAVPVSDNGYPTVQPSPKVARSLYNARCYFSLKHPSTTTEVMFQNIEAYNASLSLRIKVSEGGFASASNATQTPAAATASDEITIWGGGTNGSPTGSDALNLMLADGQKVRYMIGAYNDGTKAFLYARYWDALNPTTGFAFMWDYVDSDLSSVFTRKTAIFFGTKFGIQELSDETLTHTPTLGYGFVGRLNTTLMQRFVAAFPCYNDGAFNPVPVVKNVARSYLGSRIRAVPGIYCRTAAIAAPNGLIYGRSQAWRWNLSGLKMGDFETDQFGQTWMALDDIIVPVSLYGANSLNGVKVPG